MMALVFPVYFVETCDKQFIASKVPKERSHYAHVGFQERHHADEDVLYCLTL